jgi:hypothetical protein
MSLSAFKNAFIEAFGTPLYTCRSCGKQQEIREQPCECEVNDVEIFARLTREKESFKKFRESLKTDMWEK